MKLREEAGFDGRTAAHCRLSGWLASEGQGAAGVTVRERRGAVPQGCYAIRVDAEYFR